MESIVRTKRVVPSWAALVAANTVPIFGVLFAGWGVFPLVFLYWLENGVIGLVTLVKILFIPPRPSAGRGSRIALAALFVFHYGAFMFGHAVFILVLFAAQRPDGLEGREAFEHVLDQMLSGDVWWAAVGLAVSHGWSLVTNYLRGRGRERASLKNLMMAPYGRIILLHLFIIGSAWIVTRLGSPVGVLVLFVLLKTAVDLIAHLFEHRKAQAGATSRPGVV